MKIKMNDSRVIPIHGLKNTGDVWDAPQELAEQLIRQGIASLNEPSIGSRGHRAPKIQIQEDKQVDAQTTMVDKGDLK